LALFNINHRKLSISAVHLKAGPPTTYARVRAWEISQTMSVQSICGFDDAIIIGDFNFHSSENETTTMLDQYFIDCWKFCNGNDPGYTRNPNLNSIARIMHEISYKMKNQVIPDTFGGDRFDRIYLSSSVWNPENIRLIGNEPCGKSDDGSFDLFVSDHFGLLLEITGNGHKKWFWFGMCVCACVIVGGIVCSRYIKK